MDPRFCCLLLAVIALPESAQEPPVPAPTPPLVAPVPERADWTISVEYPAAAAQAPPRKQSLPQVTSVRSTKSGEIKHDRLTFDDGSVTDTWFVGTDVLWADPQGTIEATPVGGVVLKQLKTTTNPYPSIVTGFPGVAWVTLANYKQVEPYDNRPCYYYAKEGLEAWIDVKTGLPTGYKVDGRITYTYTFNSSPTRSLNLPPEYEKAWQIRRKLIAHQMQLEKDLR